MFKCSICGNEDEKYIGYINGKPYCRRCISFKGEPADYSIVIHKYKGQAKINYPLSEEQEKISKDALNAIKRHEDVLIYAVCGAGKTELVFKSIEYALKNKMTVGFAIPRRDVVIELAIRLQRTFKNYSVISVYGGNTGLLSGDIICLTTHQLYRYENYFDLLILDEIDAFPFKNDYVLNAMFKRSVRGNYIKMSATPSDEDIKEFKKGKKKNLLELYTRYHRKPIPVPTIKIVPSFLMAYTVLKNLKRLLEKKKVVFVFTPTIDECEILYKMLKIFAKQGNFVHSKRKNREQIIEDFRQGKYQYLVTTAVLERGVTVKDLQVIIYHANHEIYTKEALVQISGRVGRVIGATEGEVIYVGYKKTEAMVKSVEDIKRANSYL